MQKNSMLVRLGAMLAISMAACGMSAAHADEGMSHKEKKAVKAQQKADAKAKDAQSEADKEKIEAQQKADKVRANADIDATDKK